MASILDSLVPRESRPERVGPRIKAIRETLEMSKAQLADSIELNRSSLTKIEKGELGLDIYKGEAIAALYGFGLNFIYRGDLSDTPSQHRDTLLAKLVNQATD